MHRPEAGAVTLRVMNRANADKRCGQALVAYKRSPARFFCGLIFHYLLSYYIMLCMYLLCYTYARGARGCTPLAEFGGPRECYITPFSKPQH